jgi:hypothetical protein
MVQNRKLVIIPQGVVTGGEIAYAAHDSGELSVAGQLTFNYWGQHTQVINAGKTISPELLKSANCKEGKIIELDNLRIVIQQIHAGKAVCALSLSAPIVAAGTAVFDLSEELINLDSLTVHGHKFPVGDIILQAKYQP